MKQAAINLGLVCDGLLFKTFNARGRYIGTDLLEQPRWLKSNPDQWTRVVPEKADSRANADDGIATAEPDDSLSGPAAQNSTKSASTAKSELPEPNTNPLQVIGRSHDPGGDRQRKKQKRSAGSYKRPPKLSPERMIIVLESLLKNPILCRAAWKAGIDRQTLKYWLKRSEAGHDGYNIEWRGFTARFHTHCAVAINETYEKLLENVLEIGLGVKYPGTDAYVKRPNMKMLRRWLELKLPEEYGKRRKVRASRRDAVLVVGQATKCKPNTAASIRARRWKSLSKMI